MRNATATDITTRVEDLEIVVDDERDGNGDMTGIVTDGYGSYRFILTGTKHGVSITLEADEIDEPEFSIELADLAISAALGEEE
jgi:hypothetical protein